MTERFGAYGKMPALGDFFRLDLPQVFIGAWDGWLQNAMTLGQSVLGTQWDHHYMSAPLWRFTLAAGVCGPHRMMGVLMPSVDRVGRRYPLTLAAVLTSQGSAALDHFSQPKLFEQLEDIALDALEDGMTRDLLKQKLGAVIVPQTRNSAPVRCIGTSLAYSQSSTEDAMPELASGLLETRLKMPSVWSAVVEGKSRFLISEGLPDGHDVPALFQIDAPVWSEARPE